MLCPTNSGLRHARCRAARCGKGGISATTGGRQARGYNGRRWCSCVRLSGAQFNGKQGGVAPGAPCLRCPRNGQRMSISMLGSSFLATGLRWEGLQERVPPSPDTGQRSVVRLACNADCFDPLPTGRSAPGGFTLIFMLHPSTGGARRCAQAPAMHRPCLARRLQGTSTP